MPDLPSRDQWIPALLDRLTDEQAGRGTEASTADAPEHWSLSKPQLRERVVRDLRWLLNAQAMFDTWDPEITDSPALHSVINYGMPALSGRLLPNVDIRRFEQTLRQAIIDFEPRIIPETLRVSAQPARDASGATQGAMSFGIVAELRAEPYPIELLLRTVLDLDTGEVDVSTADARALRPADGSGGDGPPRWAR